MSPIRVGVVGLSYKGWAGWPLINALLQPPLSDKYILSALSTRSEKSASDTAKKYSELVKHDVKAYHGDTSSIAKDKDLDLVAVVIPSPSHLKAAMPIIEAGHNLFVEWPVGANLEETKQMRDAARKKGIRTMIGCQGRQSPAIKKAKELIDAGKLGRLLSTSVFMIAPQEMKYWGPVVSDNNTFAVDQTAGSSMIDIAVGHFIASFTYVLGDFESITATTRNNYPTSTVVDADSKPTGQVLPQTADDQGAFNGVLKSGVVASIHCRGGMKMTPGRASLVWLIDGEEGSIRVEGDGYAGSFINIRTPKLYINGEEVELLSPEESFMGNPSRAWEEYAKGDKGDYPTLDDAVRVHCVLDAIYTSAKEGKRVEIKYL